MQPLRILIADDHAVIREGLRMLLNAQEGIKVVAEASRGEDACRIAEDLNVDVVVMDVSMPGLGGAAATKRIKHLRPNVKVLALSAYEDEVYVRQLLSAGASGYVLKRTAAGEIANAIRMVSKGGLYLDPFVAKKVMTPKDKSEDGSDILSQRETCVLRLSARGLTNKEIGNIVGVSVKTVETYKTRLGRKLGFQSRADLVRYAVARGWLQEDTPEN